MKRKHLNVESIKKKYIENSVKQTLETSIKKNKVKLNSNIHFLST